MSCNHTVFIYNSVYKYSVIAQYHTICYANDVLQYMEV